MMPPKFSYFHVNTYKKTLIDDEKILAIFSFLNVFSPQAKVNQATKAYPFNENNYIQQK